MNFEVERKFWISDIKLVEQRLQLLDVFWHPAIEQCDSYFNHPQRDFAQTDEALRIRRVADRNYLTYKGPKISVTTKTRRELELPLADGIETFNNYVELLLLLGFQAVREVRKTRTIGKTQIAATAGGRPFECEIARDVIDGLGNFLELEILADESTVDQATAALQSLVTTLQLEHEERRSYLEMILEQAAGVPYDRAEQ